MIYVSQGHEKGIGLEIFLKAYVLLPKKLQKKIILSVNLETIKNVLQYMNWSYSIVSDSIHLLNTYKLNVIFNSLGIYSQTIDSLHNIFSAIRPKDILVTMPSSKDQFYPHFTKKIRGHTDLLRLTYPGSEITMNFHGNNFNCLLLSEHVPLKIVPILIKEKLIIDKVRESIRAMKQYKYMKAPKKVIIHGINPHAGEGGTIGTEENEIINAIKKLKKIFANISFVGPVGPDVYWQNDPKNTLFVFAYHDQILPAFKNQFRLQGLNITLGLPFLRLSVDHGTAFSLYGKNIANYMSIYSLLKFLE